MLSDKDITEIFSTLKALNDTERKAQKESTKNARFRGERTLRWLPAFSVIAAIVLCFLSKLSEIQLLLQISFVFLCISYLALVASHLFLAFRDIWNTIKFFRDPLDSILDTTRRYAELHATHVNSLYNYESEALKYVLVELKAGRAAWEKRTSLLVGAIEKLGIIGIIPGLIVLFKAMNTELIPSFSAPWMQSLAYATPVIYGIGLLAHDHMPRLDRFIMLIEMVIETKKSVTSEQPFTSF